MVLAQKNPSTQADRIQALEDALLGTALIPRAPVLSIPSPAGATVSYKVVALIGTDYHSAASPIATTTTGPTTLNSSNPIIVTPQDLPGATSFDIYRTAGGPSQGKIGNVLPGQSLTDVGIAGDTVVPPVTDTSSIHKSGGTQTGVSVMLVDGAIDRHAGTVMITKATAAALTLDAPSVAENGAELDIIGTTIAAHTITTPAGKIGGDDNVATFPAATTRGGLVLKAYNGVWYVKANYGAVLSGT